MSDTISQETLRAADDIIDRLTRFGLHNDSILNAIPEHDSDATTPRTAIASYATRLYRAENGLTATEKTGVLQSILARSSIGVLTDGIYHHKRNLEPEIDSRAADFGYEFAFQSLTDEWVEPDSTHPRAFRFVIRDVTTEERTTAVFRYPPREDSRSACNNQRALGAALNDTVLDAIGVRLLLLATRRDSFEWILLSQDRLTELESAYGAQLEIFGEPLVRRCPKYAFGWKQIERSPPLDHDETFGVPEPAETYKVEAEYDMSNPTAHKLW